jgi:predicted transcriptional regulator
MSPRAAWRLETLGFGEVYDYVDGKLDWMAAGLPTEGTNAQHPRAGDLARKDVPTCGLKERLGDVRKRVREQGWDSVVVVNNERVVLGLLRSKELDKDPELVIEDAMRPGPSTYRPYVSTHEMLHFMVDHNLENCPITTSDGRLIGLLIQKDVAEAMQKAS